MYMQKTQKNIIVTTFVPDSIACSNMQMRWRCEHRWPAC